MDPLAGRLGLGGLCAGPEEQVPGAPSHRSSLHAVETAATNDDYSQGVAASGLVWADRWLVHSANVVEDTRRAKGENVTIYTISHLPLACFLLDG